MADSLHVVHQAQTTLRRMPREGLDAPEAISVFCLYMFRICSVAFSVAISVAISSQLSISNIQDCTNQESTSPSVRNHRCGRAHKIQTAKRVPQPMKTARFFSGRKKFIPTVHFEYSRLYKSRIYVAKRPKSSLRARAQI